MAERDGAAVDVELLVGDAELALAVDRLAREGLVDLEEVDVVDREAGLREQLLHRRERADAHDRRVDARRCEGAEVAERLEPERLGLLAAHHERRRRAVGERRAVAGGDAALGRERGLERGEPLERGVGARQLVALELERRRARCRRSGCRCTGTISSSNLPASMRRRRLLLAGERERVLLLARDARTRLATFSAVMPIGV